MTIPAAYPIRRLCTSVSLRSLKRHNLVCVRNHELDQSTMYKLLPRCLTKNGRPKERSSRGPVSTRPILLHIISVQNHRVNRKVKSQLGIVGSCRKCPELIQIESKAYPMKNQWWLDTCKNALNAKSVVYNLISLYILVPETNVAFSLAFRIRSERPKKRSAST